LLSSYGCKAEKPVGVMDLRVFQKQEPSNIGRAPAFSWRMEGGRRNLEQVAYRLVVSSTEEMSPGEPMGDVWDSGKVASDTAVAVVYEGPSLQPAATYYWKVLVWHNQSADSVWSDVATFQTGLFDQADWQGAEWIALESLAEDKVDPLPESTKKDTWFGNNRLPLFRKSFEVDKAVVRATLFISGLGHFEASINGQRVGDHFLDAGWTKYDREALYVAFDVTDQLVEGVNAVGVMLGNGFYFIPPVKGRFRKQKVAFGYPKMIGSLVMEYADGSRSSLVSDRSWKATSGPITFSSLY